MDDSTDLKDYEMVLLLSTLGTNKIRAPLILAHMYPKALTAAQLSQLLGYSLKARTIYRGILDELEERELIYLDKLTPRVSSIRINHDNPLLNRLVELVQNHGEKYSKELQSQLEEKE